MAWAFKSWRRCCITGINTVVWGVSRFCLLVNQPISCSYRFLSINPVLIIHTYMSILERHPPPAIIQSLYTFKHNGYSSHCFRIEAQEVTNHSYALYFSWIQLNFIWWMQQIQPIQFHLYWVSYFQTRSPSREVLGHVSWQVHNHHHWVGQMHSLIRLRHVQGRSGTASVYPYDEDHSPTSPILHLGPVKIFT